MRTSFGLDLEQLSPVNFNPIPTMESVGARSIPHLLAQIELNRVGQLDSFGAFIIRSAGREGLNTIASYLKAFSNIRTEPFQINDADDTPLHSDHTKPNSITAHLTTNGSAGWMILKGSKRLKEVSDTNSGHDYLDENSAMRNLRERDLLYTQVFTMPQQALRDKTEEGDIVIFDDSLLHSVYSLAWNRQALFVSPSSYFRSV